MRRILMLTATLAAIGACAQTNGGSAPVASPAQLQADPAIAAETKALNRLTRVVIDATRLYDHAADEADDVQLQAVLRAISAQRKEFAQRLQRRVVLLGDDPANTGRETGALHGSFNALRGLADKEPAAAARDIYRAETYIINQMDAVLQTGVTPRSRSLVLAELARVTASREKVEQLKSNIAARMPADAARKRTAEQTITNPG